MLYLKVKDVRTRALFFRLENKKRINKYIFINISSITFPETRPFFLRHFLLKYSRNNIRLQSKTRLLRRCVISNRNRSIIRPYGFSRIILKNFAHFGILPGFKKAVW